MDTLPEGYTIRKTQQISANTSRKLPPGAKGALYEIAEAQGWTEWGYGHISSPNSGACERRGYIEVAEPAKPSQGRFLYRATRAGVLLVNQWRKERGEEPLPVPNRMDMPEGQELKVRHDFATDPGLPRILSPGDRPSEREWLRSEGARGDEWPESLGTFELHDAILVEPNTDRLDMLNAELRARLG